MEILYINLDDDTKRNEYMKELLKDFSYTRIPAVYHRIGPLGASHSHIKALEYAIEKGWNSVCIMEDDMTWIDTSRLEKLDSVLQNPFDVIMLCGVNASHDPETYKLFKSNCAGAYIVHKRYYSTLLANFREGCQKFEDDLNQPVRRYVWNRVGVLPSIAYKNDIYRIDTYWHSLQEKDNWFIVPIFISKPNYSNTEKKFVDYSNLFLK